MKRKKTLKKKTRKKRRIKAPPPPPHPPPHPDHLRNYEAGHTYGGLKTLEFGFMQCAYFTNIADDICILLFAFL